MKIIPIARAASALILVGAFVLSVPGAQGHPCSRDPSPGHKHCRSDPGPGPADRIEGCATFAPGPITTDGEGTYCDGNATTNYQNDPHSMQVGMNCKSNWFNLDPGGGARRIELDLSSAPVTTGISSCEGVVTPIVISGTADAVTDGINCTNTDPDWAFLQHMRAQPSDGQNVCALADTESLQATMRFQTHLFHLRTCKGGVNKCGEWLEEMEVNYDGDGCSADVTVTCIGETGGQCSTWTVASSGPGCLSHRSGAAPTSEALPFSITFQADP